MPDLKSLGKVAPGATDDPFPLPDGVDLEKSVTGEQPIAPPIQLVEGDRAVDIELSKRRAWDEKQSKDAVEAALHAPPDIEDSETASGQRPGYGVDPEEMALYWAVLSPDIEPLMRGSCVFPEMGAALRRIDTVFPRLLARAPESRSNIALAMVGDKHKPSLAVFQSDVSAARRLGRESVRLEDIIETGRDGMAVGQDDEWEPTAELAPDRVPDPPAPDVPPVVRHRETPPTWRRTGAGHASPRRDRVDAPPPAPIVTVTVGKKEPKRNFAILFLAVFGFILFASLVGTVLFYLYGTQKSLTQVVGEEMRRNNDQDLRIQELDNRTANLVTAILSKEKEIVDLRRQKAGYEGLAREFSDTRKKDATVFLRANSELKADMGRLRNQQEITRRQIEELREELRRERERGNATPAP